MARAALLIAILLTACVEHGSTPPDAAGSGSGSAAEAGDPSPADVPLEFMVVGLSALVVVGSARARRRDAKSREI